MARFPHIRIRPGAAAITLLMALFAYGMATFTTDLGVASRLALAAGALVGLPSTCLAHELGHVFFARRAGARVHYVELRWAGAMCVLEWPDNLPAYRQLPTHLGGVAVNLAGGAVFAAAATASALLTHGAVTFSDPSPLTGFLVVLAGFWLGLGVVNLIPAPGFDGLNVLWSAAAIRFDPDRSRTFAMAAGWVTLAAAAAACLVAGLFGWALVAAVIAGGSAWSQFHTARVNRHLPADPIPAD